MHVTYPLIAALFAMGFSAPLSLHRPDDWPILSWKVGGLAIVVVMFAFLAGPPLISHLIRVTTAFDSSLEINHDDLRIVPGGRFVTGFLVLPDPADLPREQPALHSSTFAQMLHIYDIDPEPSLSELLPRIPFALIYSPAQNWPTPIDYLTPSTVLTDKSPRRWLLQLGRGPIAISGLPLPGFYLADEAKPVE